MLPAKASKNSPIRPQVFEVEVFLNGLDPNTVRAELYADGINGADPVRQEMKLVRLLPGSPDGRVYQATVPAARPRETTRRE